jgi:hypothetical protein
MQERYEWLKGKIEKMDEEISIIRNHNKTLHNEVKVLK